MSFPIEILTPRKTLLKEEADEVTAPSVSGEVGILPNHADYLTLLASGELRVVKKGQTFRFPIRSGFLSVCSNQVSILVEEVEGAPA